MNNTSSAQLNAYNVAEAAKKARLVIEKNRQKKLDALVEAERTSLMFSLKVNKPTTTEILNDLKGSRRYTEITLYHAYQYDVVVKLESLANATVDSKMTVTSEDFYYISKWYEYPVDLSNKGKN